MENVSSGNAVFDQLLNGGFEKGIITTIYGPSSSGKTNICMLTLIRMAGTGKKIIYMDTESSFSIDRLCQITKYHEKVLGSTIFFRPYSFEEQIKTFNDLSNIMNQKIGLVIVDTIGMLYRLELAQAEDIPKINASLAKQMSILIKIARRFEVPVIVTNQVYSDFANKDAVKIVGGDILKNASKCIIELQKLNGKRKALLHKHRSLPEGNIEFTITEKGIKKITSQ